MEHRAIAWFESQYKYKTGQEIKLNAFQQKVVVMLDRCLGGIHNFPGNLFYQGKGDPLPWSRPEFVEVTIYKALSTYDFNELTYMVIMCHDDTIRMQITPCNMQYLTLMFHERKREGSNFERHPTIEQAILDARAVKP